MRRASLIRAGLWHYRRTHLGLLLGCAAATAVLVGALVVGDSVRHSLGRVAEARIGQVDAVLSSRDRFFREALAEELSTDQRSLAPLIELPGVASSSDGGRRVHDIEVHGVDQRFFALSPDGAAQQAPPAGEAYLNAALAERLGLAIGDAFVLRLEKPSAIPRDMALAPEDVSFALRLKIGAILGDPQFGRFGLLGSSGPPNNLFLSLHELQRELEIPGRANAMLAKLPTEAPLAAALAELEADLLARWSLDDAEMSLREVPAPGGSANQDPPQRELITSRIFFDEPIVEVLSGLAGAPLTGIFTYFVNGIGSGKRSIPYSMVTAFGGLGAPSQDPEWASLVPQDPESGILLNRWAADDLGVLPGERIELSYYFVEPNGRLAEKTRAFTLEGIVPLEGLAADPTLMPAFPGLSEADNCRDWDPGTPVDLDRIRDVDELYWDDHHGTPKAFVSLAAAREMWSSRFGQLTAVRLDAAGEAEFLAGLRAGLDPGQLGLSFRDLRTSALASAASPTDFGGLFIGLSFFLIFAALLLASQLFLFGVEERSRELGLLSALGFQKREIQGLHFREAMLLACLGAGLGVLGGLAYTQGVLWGLDNLWSDAVAGFSLSFHAELSTVLMGVGLALAAVALTLWRSLHAKLRQSSLGLLAKQDPSALGHSAGHGRFARKLAPLALAAALAIVFLVDADSGLLAAGAFFGAGSLLLCSGLAFTYMHLNAAGRGRPKPITSIAGLGRSNALRRPGRSQATLALMAIGSFLVISVGAFRKGSTQDTSLRQSGTGGFQLYGRSSLAVVHDLNESEGRAFFGLSDADLEGVSVVPFKLRAGDEASCLNLARPAQPRLLGVDPESLAQRAAFPFADSLAAKGQNPWRLLSEPQADGAIPAIGDTVSLTWQLKKGLGDTLLYQDERGQDFPVRIVGTLADTVLQGDLILDASQFSRLYPSGGGARRFLIDVADGARVEAVSERLSRAMQDVGLALESTGARMDAFHAVQNGYLGIFQMLGALGLLLGSIGLGMVVLRNTLERRGELALAAALGFRPGQVRWWLLSEYGALLAVGLGLGAASALLAILPALSVPDTELSLTNIGLQLTLVAANGLLWILLAVHSAGTRAPLAALSEE